VVNGAVLLARVLFVAVLLGLVGVGLLWVGVARRMLDRIRGSEVRYRLLFESAAVAIVMVDEAGGGILEANQLMAAWTGYDPAELPGMRFDTLLQPGSSHRVGPSLLATLAARDGRLRPVEMQVSHTAWGVRSVRQIIMRDVSERIALERERQVAAEALAGIAEGVVIADAERRVVSVNAAHAELTGFAPADVQGRRLDELHCLPGGAPLPAVAWPGVTGARHWSGEVTGRRADGSEFPEQLSISVIRGAQGEVLHYVAVFSDVQAEQSQRRRLEHLAAHDPLTGLFNRAEFERRCEEAVTAAARTRGAMAVLFVDLDAFKMVNDSYSHAIGDRLLQKVAERIGRELGAGDAAGRIGGDEFTVLLADLALREDAGEVAQRLLARLAEPVTVDDCELMLSASIGIAGYPLDGGDAPTLIANADAAMYVAKNAERNTFRYYTPVMQAHARQRLLLVSELRRALAEGEFRLMFQPGVDMQSGQIVAVEALLRWQHPERGELEPAGFIPAAESLGLIRHIDEWVLDAACRQVRAWRDAGVPAVRVAVNLSARAFGHPGFIAHLEHALRQYAIPAGWLALEITEGTMLRLGDETERTMEALHALGVEVAIDDFGTGYSSMAYLKLPSVTTLKIDRSFVTGLPHEDNDVAIARAILAMARSLGRRTIAEGIETEDQHEFLRRAGCDEGQGYLYSRPQPAAAIERLLVPQARRGTPHLRLVPPRRA
ncbi:MAG TPA: EAL domain-containing protein, partial [Rhodanobacter sp.]|nr:EAL domain-containing protein [Rhodanobacter sp.]